MLQPANAGRAGKVGTPSPSPAPAPAPGAASTAAPADAGGPPGGGLGSFVMLAPILLVFGLVFLMNRSERKKREEVESKLKKGDRVITRSGITGKLIEVSERTVRVQIAPGVNVTMVKSAIEGLDPGDDGGTAPKTDAAEKGATSKSKKKK